MNRLLRTLGAINPVLLSATSELQLFADICRTLVEHAGFAMAWVGLVASGSPRVRVLCQSGFEPGYLENIDVRYDESPTGLGPVGTAIRAGETTITDDTETSESFLPWRERARQHGYRSVCAIPLRVGAEIIGSLNVYAARPHAFGREEVVLLEKLAGDAGMAVERLRTMARIEASEHELATILHNMQDTYFRTEMDGRLTRVSESASRLLGYAPHEVQGKVLLEFYADPAARERFLAALTMAGGQLQSYELAMRHRNGSVVWVSVNAQYVRDGAARVIGIEGTARDVTERKRVEESLLEIARGVSAGTGSSFFESLVEHLALALQADYAFVGELVPERMERVRTIAVRAHGQRAENFEYELRGTPCDDVVGQTTCSYPEHVQALFPEDHLLAEMGVEAYVGTPLFGAGGAPLGLVAVLFRRPIERSDAYESTLEIFAARASAELERLRTVEALRASETNFRTLTESAGVGIMVNLDGKHVFANGCLLRLLDYEIDTFRDAGIDDIVHPEDRARIARYRHDRLRGGSAPETYETRFLTRQGETVPVELTVARTRWQGQSATLVFVRDIRDRKRTEGQMRKLSGAVEQIADSVMITDRNGIIEYVNPAFEYTTGYSSAEAVGQTPRLLKSGIEEADHYQKLWRTITSGDIFGDVLVNRRKNGSLYYEEKTITPLKDADGRITHFISTGKDVTERMQTQERLEFLAQHDALTGLPNRALLTDRFTQAIARARWHKRMVAVLFIDLDRFKTINDTLGHEVGDRLLQQLGERFRHCVREGDTVARFGGDEFVMLLDDLASDKDVVVVAQKVLDALRAPFAVGERSLYVTASIGISLFPGDGEESGLLLKNADVAMYRAKELGKNTYQFYSADMSARAFERLSLETSLRHALERGEYRLYYQPQFDTNSGRIVALEALLRWQHPDFGLVSPVEFVPLLEETGLIIPVGDWVLASACAQLQQWQVAGWTGVRVAVNLSPRQFQNTGVMASVESTVASLGCASGMLELEITEGMLMQHAGTTLEALAALRESGVRLAIDDFGTGYSSLSYLRRFPIDTLKIDRNFVHDIPDDPDDSAITTAIAALANGLNLEMVAEGVETEAQRDFLKMQGCNVMQGYLFSRPLPPDEITLLLETHNPRG